jgi:5-formyltetrahydrofolate cyclo-ligase
MNDQTALRQQLKKTRLALTPRMREQAAASAIEIVLRHPRFQRARRIAGYIGSKGELDPKPLLEQAVAMNKRCYLPVLHPFQHGRLWFYRWNPGDRMTLNRFGIPEPDVRAGGLIAARDLDLVIVPLLGFDNACHRIGMGGGYYDRSFAFARRLRHISAPFMLGFAHEAQRVDQLPQRPWDVPMDAVVTQRKLYCRPR